MATAKRPNVSENRCKVTESEYKELFTEEERQMIRESWELVLDYFHGDEAKTLTWFRVENPMLGGVSAIYMIGVGRVRKLRKFILTSLAGEGP